ncbi:hypothetical protein RchiOBHm_Chr5g0061701 [Rosa chinensis]|uniref:Uncharacterized protein n=1 Tax=Rosa chinensis TaxID=74649 RepID=A0A2P6QI09_ROSCH|nr:hypothetical protein RchiOBHm_Chr5g0061701 [Rosa chinensis]
MEIPESNSNHCLKRLPPPRGQIKKKIFKSMASVVGGFIRKPKEDGSQIPAEPRSGYSSDAQSESSMN